MLRGNSVRQSGCNRLSAGGVGASLPVIGTTVSPLGKSDDVQFALGHCGWLSGARRDVAKDSCLFRIAAVGIGWSSGVAGCGLLLQPANLPEDSEERRDLVIGVLYRLVFHLWANGGGRHGFRFAEHLRNYVWRAPPNSTPFPQRFRS